MPRRGTDVFYEYQVELEDTGEIEYFDTWEECREWVVANLYRRFHPFCIRCEKYLANGGVKTVWEVEWTEPKMKATKEDQQMFREIGASCLKGIFRMAW